MFESLDNPEDLDSKMTVPSENNLSLVDLNELFAKIELRSVLKIKVLFMKWVTELVSNTID